MSLGKRVISRRQLLGLAGAGVVSGGYVGFGERYWFQTNTYPVRIRDLPHSLDGVRVLQLTDLHYGFLMGRRVIDHVLARARDLAADLIVLTGDYVGHPGGGEDLDWIIGRFERLEAPLGVHAILGNHDYWAGGKGGAAGGERGAAALDALGISLHHRRVAIERPDGRLWLAGVGDLWEDRVDVDGVLDGVPSGEPRIVLAHNPDSMDVPRRARVDLMLSGHTHGGQVVVPFFGPPNVPIRNRRYASGLAAAGDAQIFVSRGIGWAILPVRFNCPPELAVLELRRA